MANFQDLIDRSTLAELRVHVRRLMSNNGHGLLANEIVEFCKSVRTQHGITIDLEAVGLLGEPLVIVHPAAPAKALPQIESLTPREREVAVLACSGLSNKDIATALGISLGTTKDHVHSILVKTGLPSRSALAACYVSTRIPEQTQ